MKYYISLEICWRFVGDSDRLDFRTDFGPSPQIACDKQCPAGRKLFGGHLDGVVLDEFGAKFRAKCQVQQPGATSADSSRKGLDSERQSVAS
jgi:hypothetical protein